MFYVISFSNKLDPNNRMDRHSALSMLMLVDYGVVWSCNITQSSDHKHFCRWCVETWFEYILYILKTVFTGRVNEFKHVVHHGAGYMIFDFRWRKQFVMALCYNCIGKRRPFIQIMSCYIFEANPLPPSNPGFIQDYNLRTSVNREWHASRKISHSQSLCDYHQLSLARRSASLFSKPCYLTVCGCLLCSWRQSLMGSNRVVITRVGPTIDQFAWQCHWRIMTWWHARYD